MTRSRRFTEITALTFLLSLLLTGGARGGKFNKHVDVGDAAFAWTKLEGVDGKTHNLTDHKSAKVVVVAFISNHCPIAKAYEARFKSLVKQYGEKGVKFIAINCSTTPADRLDAMKRRAKEHEFNFSYLYDPSQTTARKFGALVTPHLYVLDDKRTIAYMGAFDNHKDPAKVEYHYVIDAVDALLGGKRPEVTESLQRGCGIVYREK